MYAKPGASAADDPDIEAHGHHSTAADVAAHVALGAGVAPAAIPALDTINSEADSKGVQMPGWCLLDNKTPDVLLFSLEQSMPLLVPNFLNCLRTPCTRVTF